jgi:hypothetical protein
MNGYRAQVAAAVDAVTFRGPTQYVWLGRASRALPALVAADLADQERRRYLVACLREELYHSFYCHGAPVAARWGEPQPASADARLVEAMSRANTGRGSWEPGWTILSVAGSEAVLSGRRLRMRVPVADCDGEMTPGAHVSVRLPKELPAYSPGFWTVISDAPPDASSQAGDVRVYWNVTPNGAPALVDALTARLNGAGLPFRLKLADHPFRMERCDAAVLYLDGADFRRVRAELSVLAAALAARLHPEIPAFTLELAPGVGLAEDEGGSFGAKRCAMLADGIVRAHEQGAKRSADRVDAVVARFAEDGVAIDTPYREPSLAGRHVL